MNILRLNRLLARANSKKYPLALRAQFLAEVHHQAKQDRQISQYLALSFNRYSLDNWNKGNKS